MFPELLAYKLVIQCVIVPANDYSEHNAWKHVYGRTGSTKIMHSTISYE